MDAPPRQADVVVLGGGAAGLFCAVVAGRRGRRVLVLEGNERVGKKILVSGGGRANFTNRRVGAEHYLSRNEHFARSALARFGPDAFIALVEAHGIPYHERRHGQLFCDDSAKRITAMLLAECAAAGVTIVTNCRVDAEGVVPLTGAEAGDAPRVPDASPAPDGGAAPAPRAAGEAPRFEIVTPSGAVRARSVVVATGGLSWPRLGTSDVGYRIAERFGLSIVPPRPGLVPLLWNETDRQRFAALSGIAVPARVSCREARFEEAVLFTHVGLSGPAILQVSNSWQPGDTVLIDWLPAHDLRTGWPAAKARGERRSPRVLLGEHLPRRLADELLAPRAAGGADAASLAAPAGRPPAQLSPAAGRRPAQLAAAAERPLAQLAARDIDRLAERVHAFAFTPGGDAGWDKAEVTLGGVDVRELSSRTLEARRVPGLHFIGEVVDVTGWLGGYNFQWAWASAHAAGEAV